MNWKDAEYCVKKWNGPFALKPEPALRVVRSLLSSSSLSLSLSRLPNPGIRSPKNRSINSSFPNGLVGTLTVLDTEILTTAGVVRSNNGAIVKTPRAGSMVIASPDWDFPLKTGHFDCAVATGAATNNVKTAALSNKVLRFIDFS
jgi:hypothetical protein